MPIQVSNASYLPLLLGYPMAVCTELELLRLLVKLKRELRKTLDKKSYATAEKIIDEYMAWIEEEIAAE